MTKAHDRLERQMVDALKRHLATRKPVVVPEAGRLLWRLFVEIGATRTMHSAGPNPISYAEIMGYSQINRWQLQPHHVELIRALDDAWLQHTYSRPGSSPNGGSILSDGSGQSINPAAFDAVFG